MAMNPMMRAFILPAPLIKDEVQPAIRKAAFRVLEGLPFDAVGITNGTVTLIARADGTWHYETTGNRVGGVRVFDYGPCPTMNPPDYSVQAKAIRGVLEKCRKLGVQFRSGFLRNFAADSLVSATPAVLDAWRRAADGCAHPEGLPDVNWVHRVIDSGFDPVPIAIAMAESGGGLEKALIGADASALKVLDSFGVRFGKDSIPLIFKECRNVPLFDDAFPDINGVFTAPASTVTDVLIQYAQLPEVHADEVAWYLARGAAWAGFTGIGADWRRYLVLQSILTGGSMDGVERFPRNLRTDVQIADAALMRDKAAIRHVLETSFVAGNTAAYEGSAWRSSCHRPVSVDEGFDLFTNIRRETSVYGRRILTTVDGGAKFQFSNGYQSPHSYCCQKGGDGLYEF